MTLALILCSISLIQACWLSLFNPLQPSSLVFSDAEAAYFGLSHDKSSATGEIKEKKGSKPTKLDLDLSELSMSLPYLPGSVVAGWGLPTPYRVQFYPFASPYLKDLSEAELFALNGYAHLIRSNDALISITRTADTVIIPTSRWAP